MLCWLVPVLWGAGRWAALASGRPVGAARGAVAVVVAVAVPALVAVLGAVVRACCPGPAAAAAAAALCQQLRGRRIDRGRERTAPLKCCPGAPDGLLFPEERAWERRVQNLVRAAVEAAVIVPPSAWVQRDGAFESLRGAAGHGLDGPWASGGFFPHLCCPPGLSARPVAKFGPTHTGAPRSCQAVVSRVCCWWHLIPL